MKVDLIDFDEEKLGREVIGKFVLQLDTRRLRRGMAGYFGWRFKIAWMLIKAAGLVLRCEAGIKE